MAVTNDCEHKVPEFLCRHCAGKDRSGGVLACDVVPADHEQTKTVERRILDAATAVEEVHRGPVGRSHAFTSERWRQARHLRWQGGGRSR